MPASSSLRASRTRVAILSKLGLLFENEVKDDGEAIKAYLSITDMAPDDKGALAALARLYERGEKWQELADVLQRQMVVIGLENEPRGAPRIAA